MKAWSFVLGGTVAIASLSCEKKQEHTSVTPKYLYVASGQCYSGAGINTFSNLTSSNLIFKVDTTSGIRQEILADYFASPAAAGDTPSSFVDWDSNNLLVYVRNGNTARLETLTKKGGLRNFFGTSPAMSTIVTTAPKTIKKSSDGGLLMIRTGYIEKVNTSGVRSITPFVSNNLGATCGTANALYTDIAVSATGKIITANAAAAPNNRLISTAASGATGTCLGASAAPATTTYATAMVYDQVHNKLLVAYAGNNTAANINSIQAYDFNEDTGAISNAQVIYDANAYPATYNYLLFGISSMVLDPETNHLYVATAISTATTVTNYAIEKLNYNASAIGSSNSTVLTREGSLPFYNYGVDTKCISAMAIGTESAAAAE